MAMSFCEGGRREGRVSAGDNDAEHLQSSKVYVDVHNNPMSMLLI